MSFHGASRSHRGTRGRDRDPGTTGVLLLTLPSERKSRGAALTVPRPSLNSQAASAVATPDKLVGFLLGACLRIPVPLLQFADELILLTADLIQLVVGQGTPLLANLPLQLLPLALDRVPVHDFPPIGRRWSMEMQFVCPTAGCAIASGPCAHIPSQPAPRRRRICIRIERR